MKLVTLMFAIVLASGHSHPVSLERLRGNTLSAVAVKRTALAPDSIIATGSITIGAGDGKGELDSVRVLLMGLDSIPKITVWRRPVPIGTLPYSFRFTIPTQSGTATYNVFSLAISYRRGLTSQLRSLEQPVTIADIPPPAPTANSLSVVTKR